ncbi:MAG: phage holin family protein [Prevotella sp.]|nr:phage holin family protein [Prevotella sp.]
MFSNDQNIETIGQLVEAAKHYVGLQKEYVKLDLIEKIVRLITVLTLTVVLALTLLFALIYVSFAVAYALSGALGLPGAFLCVSGFYVALFLLLLAFRERWIERPVVRFLASLLME